MAMKVYAGHPTVMKIGPTIYYKEMTSTHNTQKVDKNLK